MGTATDTRTFSNTLTVEQPKTGTTPFVDKNMLHNLLSVQSKSGQTEKMQRFITRFAKKQGATVTTEDGNIYVTKGEADLYPCMVAHTDTVHKLIPEDAFSVYTTQENDDTLYFGWDRRNQTFSGVGGDDKVGIFLALSALVAYDAIKLAFFRDEEIGCIGSGKADMTFFDDVSMVLQGDRRGNSDFVTSISGSLSSQEFQNAIKPILDMHGYRFTTGMMTDVDALKDNGLNVSCANFSCGYWNPHGPQEYISLGDVENTLSMVYMTFDKMSTQKWPHTAVRGSKFSSWTQDDEDWGAGWDHYRYGGGTRRADTFRPSRKTQTEITSYRTVSDDGPSVPNDWYTYLQLTADGYCPLCKQDAYIVHDHDLDKYYCERCVVYLDAA